MRKISIICSILESLYLCLFIISINCTVYYLPMIWSVSASLFTLNFARNRDCLQLSYLKCKSFIRSRFDRKSQIVHAHSPRIDGDIKKLQPPQQSVGVTLHIHGFNKTEETESNTKDKSKKMNTTQLTVDLVVDNKSLDQTSDTGHKTRLSIRIDAPKEEKDGHCNVGSPKIKSVTFNNAERIKRNKALDLLGVTPAQDNIKKQESKSKIINKAKRSQSTNSVIRKKEKKKKDERPRKHFSAGLSTLSSFGFDPFKLHTDTQSISEIPDEAEMVQMENDASSSPELSHSNVSTDNVDIPKMKDFQSGSNNNLLPPLTLAYSTSNPVKLTPSTSHSTGSVHHISPSAPFPNINVQDINNKDKDTKKGEIKTVTPDINQAVRSLNALLNHGFYSTRNVNNINQLMKNASTRNLPNVTNNSARSLP